MSINTNPLPSDTESINTLLTTINRSLVVKKLIANHTLGRDVFNPEIMVDIVRTAVKPEKLLINI